MTAPRPAAALVPVAVAQVTCDHGLYYCRCVLPLGHDGDVHECAETCGGKWRPNPESRSGFDIVDLPSGPAGSGLRTDDVGNPYRAARPSPTGGGE